VEGPLPYILSPASEGNDPFHVAEYIGVDGVNDSAAVWNVYMLALDSDRVDEPVWSLYEEGGAAESLPNSDMGCAVGDEVRGCEEVVNEGVVSDTDGGETGSDNELSFLDIDEERSGWEGDASAPG
jgi:hypothetical protein